MNVNKIKITAIVKILILILLILTGYFIWVIFSGPVKPKSEQAFIPPVNNEIKISGPKPIETEKITLPESPSLSNKPKAPTSITPFFEEINEATKTLETKLKNEIAAPTLVAPSASAPSAPSNTRILKSTPTEIILSLTNNEFHFLYPDTFIASLIDAQNFFIKSYDPAYEPLLKIETDSQVRYVEEKIVAALLSANMLTKEEAERFITTIRLTLPQFQLTELKNQKFPSSIQSLINKFSINQSSAPFPQPLSNKGLFLAGLMEKLYNAFVPKAQAYACGYCYWLPECFQPGASAPTPGPNLWFAACYCTGCYSSLGCLSFCTGRAAIYDPMTGICGCG
ncbi:MAG: hypothetical protein NTV77_00960 [Candidatus Azambacteria bacterium]|nr:hypothetical protein [Candidatus Azambacteria bacterium]